MYIHDFAVLIFKSEVCVYFYFRIAEAKAEKILDHRNRFPGAGKTYIHPDTVGRYVFLFRFSIAKEVIKEEYPLFRKFLSEVMKQRGFF